MPPSSIAPLALILSIPWRFGVFHVTEHNAYSSHTKPHPGVDVSCGIIVECDVGGTEAVVSEPTINNMIC